MTTSSEILSAIECALKEGQDPAAILADGSTVHKAIQAHFAHCPADGEKALKLLRDRFDPNDCEGSSWLDSLFRDDRTDDEWGADQL